MAITKLTKDMAIISKLSDEPNDASGMTSAELKAKFDEAGESVKEYINETLLPSLKAENIAFTPTAAVPDESDVQGAIGSLHSQLVNATLGELPNGSIAEEKLTEKLQQSISSAAKRSVHTITVAESAWQGSEKPFTAHLAQSYMLASDTPHITCTLSHSSQQSDNALLKAWAMVTDAVAINGALILYAEEKPTVSIPLQIEVIR